MQQRIDHEVMVNRPGLHQRPASWGVGIVAWMEKGLQKAALNVEASRNSEGGRNRVNAVESIGWQRIFRSMKGAGRGAK